MIRNLPPHVRQYLHALPSGVNDLPDRREIPVENRRGRYDLWEVTRDLLGDGEKDREDWEGHGWEDEVRVGGSRKRREVCGIEVLRWMKCGGR